jgi:hypothetical protein
MTRSFFSSIKKLCLEPGVLFPIANIFVFWQSGNMIAFAIALLNVALSIAFTLVKKPPMPPLLVTAWLVLLCGLLALAGGAWLPGIAGLFFASGNFLNCHKKSIAALHDPATRPLRRVATHPAMHYSFGYCIIGLLAGGGLGLLEHPLDHPQAVVMVGSGALTIILASFGLALGFLKTAIPFWILAGGNGINMLAGVVTGNFIGAANCLFPMLGEARLGWMTQETAKENLTGKHHGL